MKQYTYVHSLLQQSFVTRSTIISSTNKASTLNRLRHLKLHYYYSQQWLRRNVNFSILWAQHLNGHVSITSVISISFFETMAPFCNEFLWYFTEIKKWSTLSCPFKPTLWHFTTLQQEYMKKVIFWLQKLTMKQHYQCTKILWKRSSPTVLSYMTCSQINLIKGDLSTLE